MIRFWNVIQGWRKRGRGRGMAGAWQGHGRGRAGAGQGHGRGWNPPILVDQKTKAAGPARLITTRHPRFSGLPLSLIICHMQCTLSDIYLAALFLSKRVLVSNFSFGNWINYLDFFPDLMTSRSLHPNIL